MGNKMNPTLTGYVINHVAEHANEEVLYWLVWLIPGMITALMVIFYDRK